MSGMIPAEGEDLKVHVALCAQRHEQVNTRLRRIEQAQWASLLLIAGATGAGVLEVVPILRALAGQ